MYKDKLIDKVFNVINISIMLLVIVVTLYPVIYLISKSLSSVEYVKAGMVYLWPRGFSLSAYEEVFSNELFLTSYRNTIVYTVLGTTINLVMTTSMAYCLSRRNLVFRKSITLLVVFTMFFGGGMIPNFLLIKWLKMYDTIWALVIPGAISTYNMIIVRTYMQGIPEEIVESVRIDGANDIQIFIKMILPLSIPVIATIGLFYAVGHWNSYFNAMLYLDEKKTYPLQLILKEMIVEQDMQGMSSNAFDVVNEQPPSSEMLVSASIVMSLIPVLIAYPFVQRFFIKGVMIGSVKG
ncbi:MAG: carbohydrate ABC transporter permease [Clostridia bacterium]|nr:carbohydrate ABC transporter permease [Clostridia bacterium]